jgi:hypothetical protein
VNGTPMISADLKSWRGTVLGSDDALLIALLMYSFPIFVRAGISV